MHDTRNTTQRVALTFDRDHVKSLVEHSLEATRRSPTIGQRHLGSVPAGLWLVADGGVYLMSNGQDEHGRHGKAAHAPAFALEANPEAVPFKQWNGVRGRMFNGSDGAEFIEAEVVWSWVCDSLATLRLHVDEDHIGFTPDPKP